MNQSEWIWHNGEMKKWLDAKVHVLAHGLHYGSSVFEGIRGYATPKGPAIFRLREHTERLLASAKIHRIDVPWSASEIDSICCELIQKNELTQGAYIRPIIYRGYGGLSLAPKPGDPVEMAIAAWQWGTYLGDDAIEHGVDACISSWQRIAPNTLPAMAKAGGNYLSGTLISIEARERGFHEGIALSVDGMVSEGAGENIFVIKDGSLMTPPSAASILAGITRASAIELAKDAGYKVIERSIPREMLYLADEIFMTGTAAEITPVRSVDGLKVGNGKPGPITKDIQQRFFGLFDESYPDTHEWLHFV